MDLYNSFLILQTLSSDSQVQMGYKAFFSLVCINFYRLMPVASSLFNTFESKVKTSMSGSRCLVVKFFPSAQVSLLSLPPFNVRHIVPGQSIGLASPGTEGNSERGRASERQQRGSLVECISLLYPGSFFPKRTWALPPTVRPEGDVEK